MSNTCKFYSLDGACLVIKTISIRAAREYAGSKGYFRRGTPQGNLGHDRFLAGREALRKSIVTSDKHKLETVVMTAEEMKPEMRTIESQMEKGLKQI